MVGIRFRDLATRPNLRQNTCKICRQETSKTYVLRQQVVKLAFLPLFPIGRVVFITCSHCRTYRELKSGATQKLDQQDETIKAEMLNSPLSPFNLRDVWGGVLLFLLLCGFVYMVVTHSR